MYNRKPLSPHDTVTYSLVRMVTVLNHGYEWMFSKNWTCEIETIANIINMTCSISIDYLQQFKIVSTHE